MSRSTRFSWLGAPAAALALSAVALAQDEGVKQVEQLTKKSGAMVEAIAGTRQQLQKTLEVYNSLMADAATDRKGLYKKLQSEMATTEKKRGEITMRAEEARLEADAVFKSWAASMAAIGDAGLRKRSEDRLERTKASFAQIGAAGQKASEAYGPLMKALDDQVTYLGHDLNPSAIASLKPDAAKLNTQAGDVAKRIDETISTANAAIGSLRPE
jgi:phosphoenolpyruvate-protein kinase (PTS system EI component)